MFLEVGTLLTAAWILGELARRFNQPAILGEILAGILLGPTVLGSLAPESAQYLFPAAGGSIFALNGLTTLAIALFLLVAGMEVDVSRVWKQGRTASWISLAGIVAPFAVGFLSARTFPGILGQEPGADPFIFALFFATALSISALPVIAKTLMDLDLYRTDLGMTVIAAAVCDDLVGWMIFAMILSLMPAAGNHHLSIAGTIWLTLGFAGFILTVGRSLIRKALPWIQSHTTRPGGVLTFALAIAIFGAAFTEWVGVHVIFGAFLVGVAIGDSPHFCEHTRTTLKNFVSFIFAPLFFASIGLRVNFWEHFDFVLVGSVLGIASIGKIFGCTLVAQWSGLPSRQAWALGFGMNARGAMEIILGLLAQQNGLIGTRMFVALVIMALVTSMISGPAMQRILELKKSRSLDDYLKPRTSLHPQSAHTRRWAIHRLARSAGKAYNLDFDPIESTDSCSQQIKATDIDDSVIFPHAYIGEH